LGDLNEGNLEVLYEIEEGGIDSHLEEVGELYSNSFLNGGGCGINSELHLGIVVVLAKEDSLT